LALDDLLNEIGTRSGSTYVNEIPEGGAAQVDGFASVYDQPGGFRVQPPYPPRGDQP